MYPALRKWPAGHDPHSRDERGVLEPDDELGVTVFTKSEDAKRHYRAPDGSEIWEMGAEDAGGLALCYLSPGLATIPVFHPAHLEIWYVLSGSGQLSRRPAPGCPADDGRQPEVVDLTAGTCVDIPSGTTFQFRSGDAGLRMLLLTMPRRADGAAVEDRPRCTWPPTVAPS